MMSTSGLSNPHSAMLAVVFIDLDLFLLFKSHIFVHEVCQSVSVSSCQQQPSTFEPQTLNFYTEGREFGRSQGIAKRRFETLPRVYRSESSRGRCS